MSLALVSSAAQEAQPEINHQELINLAANNIQAAARITDVDDMRYFNMRDLSQVRINLHLALELLEVLRRASVPPQHRINQ